ncbi:MAG: response regulator, partial [Granulosicoccus sp.]|nr:response regulator [Granulosicoccus sp.]
MTTKVLLVEPSSTMRYVAQKYVEDEGYDLQVVETYREAADALRNQFDAFDADFDYLLLGWPAERDKEATRLLGMLEGVDYNDLTVVVLSQDMRPDARAWVAAREHCVMLKWKDYQKVSELMEHRSEPVEEDPLPTFENGDIRILCVDDSASIRYALRDLLEMHGYEVTAVGGYSEALAAVRGSDFDIALLDFYLQDSTGDELCRALLTETSNELICAVLTGTYSDHIIKRSLMAGAIECMFKNESSDLLLARLGALSRVIRNQRTLQTQQTKMNTVIEAVAGSVVVFDEEGMITYVNRTARKNLGHADEFTLVGHTVADTVNAELTSVDLGRRTRGRFSTANGAPVDVLFRCSGVKTPTGESSTIVVFKTLEEIASNGSGANSDPKARFLKVLAESRRGLSNGQLHTSVNQQEACMLLMLDIGYNDKHGVFHPISDSEEAVNKMLEGLGQVYRRRNHIA